MPIASTGRPRRSSFSPSVCTPKVLGDVEEPVPGGSVIATVIGINARRRSPRKSPRRPAKIRLEAEEGLGRWRAGPRGEAERGPPVPRGQATPERSARGATTSVTASAGAPGARAPASRGRSRRRRSLWRSVPNGTLGRHGVAPVAPALGPLIGSVHCFLQIGSGRAVEEGWPQLAPAAVEADPGCGPGSAGSPGIVVDQRADVERRSARVVAADAPEADGPR